MIIVFVVTSSSFVTIVARAKATRERSIIISIVYRRKRMSAK